MKKILFAFIFIASTMGASAQFLKLGVEGGATGYKVVGQSFNNQFDLGYLAGAFGEIKLGKNWYLKPEAQFAESQLRRTSQFSSVYNNLLNGDTLSKIKLQYLAIPISLNYKLANILSLGVGVQYGIQMNSHETLLKNGSNAFKNGDFAATGSATFMLGRFRLGAKYIVGLNSLNDISNQSNWKSQSVQASLGIVL